MGRNETGSSGGSGGDHRENYVNQEGGPRENSGGVVKK